MRSFLVIVLLLATSALAAPAKGGKLYIKTKDTKLRKDPSLKAQALVTLQAGKEVTWNGVSEKDKEWHSVTVDGKKGFVQRGDLSPHAPMHELSGTQTPISQQAFATTGFTKCSFGPPTIKHASSPAEAEATAELIYLEELNREKATPAAIEAKNKELHR